MKLHSISPSIKQAALYVNERVGGFSKFFNNCLVFNHVIGESAMREESENRHGQLTVGKSFNYNA